MTDPFPQNQTESKPENTVVEEQKNVPHVRPTRRDVGLLSTFVRDPLGVKIAEQQIDEHILLFIRRDFVVNVPWILFALFLILFPLLAPTLLSPINSVLIYLSKSTIAILVIFYYLLLGGYIFGNFVTWFYDIGIVTQERAVDIDFYNLSYVSVATARSQDLKEVRYFQRGVFESLFDYGDVTIVVEASGESLTFEKTPRPAEAVSILSALIGGHQKKNGA